MFFDREPTYARIGQGSKAIRRPVETSTVMTTEKTYSKPTLKKHPALKQITFSGHGSPENEVLAVRELPSGNFEVQYGTGDPVEMVPADARLKTALEEFFDPMAK